MKHGVTMILPGETEAGSAGMQPCRGIAWWAHRDDDRERGSSSLALFQNYIGSKDPHASKIPARRAEFSITETLSFRFTLNQDKTCSRPNALQQTGPLDRAAYLVA